MVKFWFAELIKNVISTLDVWLHMDHACIGARDNSYHEMAYNGPSSFVGAVTLVHTTGRQKRLELKAQFPLGESVRAKGKTNLGNVIR